MKSKQTWRAITTDGRVWESVDAGTLFQWGHLFNGTLERFEVVTDQGMMLRVLLGPEDRLIYRDRVRRHAITGNRVEGGYCLIGFRRAGFMALGMVGENGEVTVAPDFPDGVNPIPFMECEVP